MDFAHLGPIQMIIVGFDEDADYQGLILDELERLSCRGLIRVIDLKFFFKETNDQLLSLELTELTDTEIAEYGAVINGLLGLSALHSEQAHTDALDAYDHSFGLTPDDIKRIASELEPGEAVGMLLFEHVWAARLKQAIRLTGGYPIAQGLLTPEALMMVGEEVNAIVEAEMTIELAEAVKGAAILDALTTVELADQVKAAAAAEAAQALIVAGLIDEAAAQEAIDVLISAGLIEASAVREAEQAADDAQNAVDETITAIERAVGRLGI